MEDDEELMLSRPGAYAVAGIGDGEVPSWAQRPYEAEDEDDQEGTTNATEMDSRKDHKFFWGVIALIILVVIIAVAVIVALMILGGNGTTTTSLDGAIRTSLNEKDLEQRHKELREILQFRDNNMKDWDDPTTHRHKALQWLTQNDVINTNYWSSTD